MINLETLDFSHPYTTSREHCQRLLDVALELDNPQTIVEIGSYIGVSTLFLAKVKEKYGNVKIISVDKCDEIDTLTRQTYWTENSCNYIISLGCTAVQFLDSNTEKYDMIFHDAAHGDAVLHEYLHCWNKVKSGGIFAMHDFDQISNKSAFLAQLQRCKREILTDEKGRMTAIFWKP